MYHNDPLGALTPAARATVERDLAAQRVATDALLAAAESLVGDFQVDEKLKYAAVWVSDTWVYRDVTKLRDAIATVRALARRARLSR